MDSKKSNNLDENMKKSLVFKFENDDDSQILCINFKDKDQNLKQSNYLFKLKTKSGYQIDFFNYFAIF